MREQGSWQQVCPQCQAKFLGLEDFCPHDGTPLVAAGAAGAWGERVGQVLDERFVLQKVLGQGGMGIVYLARHTVLDRVFAIKLLRRELLGDAKVLQRFQREARTASRVLHPNIVHTYDFGRTRDGQAYLVMEYVHGISLYGFCERFPGRQVHISQAVDITLQVTQALTAAHAQGIIHRDIKPENILLMYVHGQPDFVKVTDFGVARLVGEERLTVDGGIVGTPAFISPEMLSGSEVGPAADMYAVGIMLHELIVGSPPFSGSMDTVLNSHVRGRPPTLRQRRPDAPIPQALDELVERLLAKKPAERPTAQQTANVLMELRPNLPPRSVRSVVVAETLVLVNRLQRGSLYDAETLLLSPDRPDLMRTLELPPLLRQVDQVDFEMERSSQQLYRLSVALISRRWPTRPPAELTQQRQHLEDLAKAEEELGLQLALLNDRVDTAEQAAAKRRAEIHAQMMVVREELDEWTPLGQAHERRLHERILTLERSYAEVTVEDTAARELSQQRPRLQELRSEIQRSRRELAAMVHKLCAQDPKSRADTTIKAACQALEKALREFDTLCSSMTVLMQRFATLTHTP